MGRKIVVDGKSLRDVDARVRRVCEEMKREAAAARPAGETFDSDWVDGWAEAVLSALDGKGGDE